MDVIEGAPQADVLPPRNNSALDFLRLFNSKCLREQWVRVRVLNKEEQGRFGRERDDVLEGVAAQPAFVSYPAILRVEIDSPVVAIHQARSRDRPLRLRVAFCLRLPNLREVPKNSLPSRLNVAAHERFVN